MADTKKKKIKKISFGDPDGQRYSIKSAIHLWIIKENIYAKTTPSDTTNVFLLASSCDFNTLIILIEWN